MLPYRFRTSMTLEQVITGLQANFNVLAGKLIALASSTPLMNGTAHAGTAETASRADHVHPTDTSRAPAAAGMPTGGSVGQAIVKTGAANYATTWGGLGMAGLSRETWGPTARMQGVQIIPEGALPTDNGSGSFTIPTCIVMNPAAGSWFRIAGGTYGLSTWGYLYVDMPPAGTARGTLTPAVGTWSDADRIYDHSDRLVLAQRNGTGNVALSPLWTYYSNQVKRGQAQFIGQFGADTYVTGVVANDVRTLGPSITVEGDGCNNLFLEGWVHGFTATVNGQYNLRIHDSVAGVRFQTVSRALGGNSPMTPCAIHIGPFTGTRTFTLQVANHSGSTADFRVYGGSTYPQQIAGTWA